MKLRPFVFAYASLFFALLCVLLLFTRGRLTAQDDVPVVGINRDGTVNVPSYQLLSPAGRTTLLAQRPIDMALSPDGRTLAVTTTSSTLLIDAESGEIVFDFDKTNRSTAGVAFSPDGETIFYARGGSDMIGVASMLDDRTVTVGEGIYLGKGTFPAGMSVSPDGSTLYVALLGTHSLGIVNLTDKTLTTQPVGTTPFGAYVTPNSRYVFVSNWGGTRPTDDSRMDDWIGVFAIDPVSGANIDGTVSVYDTELDVMLTDIVVGLHPTAITFDADSTRMYVANANDDTVSVVDITTTEFPVIETISVRPEGAFPFGSMPNGLVLSADGSTLYVANGGNNAVAVVSLGTSARPVGAAGAAENSVLAGMIPVEWFPVGVALNDAGNTLYVANNKGQGSTNFLPEYIARSAYAVTGSLSTIPVPSADELTAYTATVDANSGYLEALAESLMPARADATPVPVPERLGEPSVFKHVIYVIKENRTYDQVFGDLPQGNGEPSLTMFPREVTPNHHALAERFGLFDNFYTVAVNTADAHMWLNEGAANVFTERVFGMYPLGIYGTAPLNLPVDSLWTNALAHGLTIRNYGEMTLHVTHEIQPDGTYARTDSWTWTDMYQDWLDQDTERYRFESIGNLFPALEENSMIGFPGFDLSVPDQMRVDLWEQEFVQHVANGTLPDLSVIWLPVNHTSASAVGYPTPRAMVADNDLALGRIVEAVSNSPYWENTVIFVLEDDAQDGIDHVDGHRTIGFAISAYNREGVVISDYYNSVSMFRTIEQILGLPPINQFDLIAPIMFNAFDTEPDLTPYTAIPNNIPLDEMNPDLDSLEGIALADATVATQMNWRVADINDWGLVDRMTWRAVMGDQPYPTLPWLQQVALEDEAAEAAEALEFLAMIQASDPGSAYWGIDAEEYAVIAPERTMEPTPEVTPEATETPMIVMSIADAREQVEDTVVTVQGRVTVLPEGFYGLFYIQDATGGIRVEPWYIELPTLTIGDNVTVSGTISVNENRQVVLTADALTVDSAGEAIVPMMLESTGDAEAFHGQLVRTEARIVATVWYWGDDMLEITTSEDVNADKLIVMYFYPTEISFGFSQPLNGATVCVTGILESAVVTQQWRSLLLPRTAADIKLGACDGPV